MALVYCPACNSAMEKDEGAEDVAESHNQSRHGGEQFAQVFPSGEVNPDEVNALYDSIRSETSEQRQRFSRRMIRDDRFNITAKETPDRDEVREWILKT